MSIRALLKRPTVESTAPAPAPGADRSRLKAALASRAQAIQAVADARASLGRLGEIARISDDAAHDAEAAQRTEKEFRAEWARSGCQPFPCTELDALTALAAQKSQAAQAAAANAEAADKEISGVEEAARRGRSDIASIELEIEAAVGAILVIEAAPLLERLQRCAEEYRSLRLQAVALMKQCTPRQFADASSNQAAVENVLVDAHIAPLDWYSLKQLQGAQPALDAFSAPLRERAAALVKDPNS